MKKYHQQDLPNLCIDLNSHEQISFVNENKDDNSTKVGKIVKKERDLSRVQNIHSKEKKRKRRI